MLKNKFAIGCKKKNAIQNNMIHVMSCDTCHVMSMSCVCVLECDPHDIGIAVSYCFVLHFFFLHPMANFFLACLF